MWIQTTQKNEKKIDFDHDKQTNTYGYYIHGLDFYPTTTYRVYSFPTKKDWVHFPKKNTPQSKSDTSPSASSHMDASHCCRELNLPDSELTHLGSALPSRDFLS